MAKFDETNYGEYLKKRKLWKKKKAGVSEPGERFERANQKGDDTPKDGSKWERLRQKAAGIFKKKDRPEGPRPKDDRTEENRPDGLRQKAADIFREWKGLLLFPLFLLYDEIVLRLLSGQGWFSHAGYVFGFAFFMALLLAGLTLWIPRRPRRVTVMVILTVFGVYFAIECVIHNVFVNYLAPTNLFSEGGNVADKYHDQLVRSILFGIPKGLLFIVPPIIYYNLARKRARREPYPKWLAALLAALGIGGTFLMAGAAISGPQGATYTAQFNFTRATDTFGLVTSTRLSLRNSVFGNPWSSFHTEEDPAGPTEAPTPTPKPPKSSGTPSPAPTPFPVPEGRNEMDIDFDKVWGGEAVQNLTQYIKKRKPTSKNAYTGLFEGKNLIMIAAESYTGCFISPELTPTLWRLTHNGFYFSDYYQVEWGGSTTTGETSILVGIAPQWGDQAMIYTAGNNNYFTMGNQLQRLGYSSIAFHNGSSNYYQRQNTHLNLGYNQWVANDTGIADLCGKGWVQDRQMFENTIPLFIDHSPFSVYYMTISGHAPYNTTENFNVQNHYERVNAIVGDKYKEITKYYLCYQMELEDALTLLVEKLEEAGIADDTVIMLVGDHYPYGLCTGEAWGNDQNYLLDLLKTEMTPDWNRDKNNLIIWSGCLEHDRKDYACEISTPTFNLDILPTLSNLFGLEYDSRLLPGRDVFSEAKPLVYWGCRDWITEKGRYLAINDTYYPNEGEKWDEQYFRGICSQVENRLLLSRVVVETNYYQLLFGPDTVTLAGDILYPEGGQTAKPYAWG